MRWNVRAERQDPKMEEIILKTLSAFSNSRGGTLLIGVNDDGEVLGLDDDYKTFRGGNGDADQFEIHLGNLTDASFGADFAATQMDVSFPKVGDKEFCKIVVERGSEAKYVNVTSKNGQKAKTFYVRSGNSSKALSLEESVKYISDRFN